MGTNVAIGVSPWPRIRSNKEGMLQLVDAQGRVLLVDLLRGLLILLMASSHAVGLAGLPAGSFWRSHCWLPRGWATDAFITVSGITAAIVYDWVLQPERAKRGLRRRAWQLLLVMFISNVVLLITKYVPLHEIDRIKHLSWWIGLVTFKTEYSISGVLLPTAVLLLILPAVNYLRLRFGAVPMAAVSVLVATAVRVELATGSPRTHSILSFGAGFPVIPMVCCGVLGFFAGVALKRFDLRRDLVFKTAVLPSTLVLVVPFFPTPHLSALITATMPLMRVALLSVIAVAILLLPRSLDWKGAFGILGRFSLFCFLGHRVVMHAVIFMEKDVFAARPDFLYETTMLFTFGVLGFLCWLRLKLPAFDEACKRVYL